MSKTLIVTGASAGIGAATARMAPSKGYTDVVVHYGRDLAGAEAVAKDVEAAGAKAHVIGADVADMAAVAAMFAQIAALPPAPLHLMNNAGIVAPKAGIADLTPERVHHVFAVNVFGALEVCRRAVGQMRDWGQGGSIVNISSVAARLGAPNEYTDYAAAKGAIDTMTTGMAVELGPEGIRVNCLRPGPIETEIHAKGGQPDRLKGMGDKIPLGRAGTAEEIAASALWLLSDEASYVSGAFLDVAGGR
ncbi:SDR family oxidoreductase [Pacificoceanicola onchidii]|uniref:SDR family oxidoreductase n=1 Tax=Pacificoceanicola onchidii TaxID=2562685 RepID=UPI0010A38973|nr:SDR family oxidoreductase [Pacificoceanicola onchidii]